MKDLLLETMRPTQESNVFWLMSYVLVVVAAAQHPHPVKAVVPP